MCQEKNVILFIFYNNLLKLKTRSQEEIWWGIVEVIRLKVFFMENGSFMQAMCANLGVSGNK